MPSNADRQEHVDNVVAQLGLTPARDVVIGNAKMRGQSLNLQ